ncbi:MAG: SUMF1/EgtB/PvdO family nonheme iron enzyme [Mangrovibacterium sp.]
MKDISGSAKFCPECGVKIEIQGKTCPNPECGREGLPPEALYCPDCGNKMIGSTSGFASFTEMVNGVSFKMVAVEGGILMMGRPADGSGVYNNALYHRIKMSNYYIGQTVVTQSLWEAVLKNNPSFSKGDNLPVEQVKWNDCQLFIQHLNQLTGKKYSLPTEAQWEFSAHGGTRCSGYQYAGSNEPFDVAWFDINSGHKIHPVSTKLPNELGLYDLSGNVFEWCQDWYGDYRDGEQTDPAGPTFGTYRVYRGGSWRSRAQCCWVVTRDHGSPNFRSADVGFRLALVP